MVTQRAEIEPDAAAARSQELVGGPLTRASGYSSNSDEGEDEDDEDCSNRGTDGVSSSASSSEGSFDG